MVVKAEPRPLVTQPSLAPTRKVAAGTSAGLVLLIVGWIDDQYLGNQAPETVEGALVILAFSVTAFFVRNRKAH